MKYKFSEIMQAIYNRPKWMEEKSVSYVTVMGSHAYGTNTPSSDMDFYGFCVPPVEIVFPHTAGQIQGFGRNIQKFEQYEQQHVKSEKGEFDIAIYNIVKYFQLVMDGNPNMVDSLFTDDSNVVFMDEIGKTVRDNRKLFLSQKMYHTFKGMMWSHMSRLKSGRVKEGRKKLAEEFGYDTKDAYHTLRMAYEMAEVLFTGDLSLKQHSEKLKEVRGGGIPVDLILQEAEHILMWLEKESGTFVVPYNPPEEKIRDLLLQCLEARFGSLKNLGVAKKY